MSSATQIKEPVELDPCVITVDGQQVASIPRWGIKYTGRRLADGTVEEFDPPRIVVTQGPETD